MIVIDEKDIEKTENKFGITFDESRKEAIKNIETADIIACAGSGKTTMMCAKIDILTKKQPFNNNKGIAVLSLTNVAIEQIRSKLGKKHEIFRYPNYCETIQKFVTTFVLNSWYNSKFKKKIEIIDNDFFVQEIKKKIDYKKISYLERVNFLFEEIHTDGDNVFYNNINLEKKKISGLTNNKNEEYIDTIKNAKLQLVSEGIFNYRDAFEISTKYLKENRQIKNYIKQRFQICFVDEMQDCRKWEKEFLEECFSEICFQKIGDPNQQIYEDTYWTPINSIHINNSIRNSIEIAEFARRFEDIPNEMVGNKKNNIRVKILVYDIGNIFKVKEKFVEEIIKEKLDKKNEPIFKMIGKVIKRNPNGKIELFDFANHTIEKETNIYNDFFYKNLKQNKNRIRKTLIDVMYYTYKKIDKINLEKINNKKEFINRIDSFIDNDELYKKLKNNKNEIVEFSKKYIKDTLINIFKNKKYFLGVYNSIIDEKTTASDFLAEYIKDKIKVEVKSIAGVKGETHTATLVCETFYKNYDIEYILDNHIRQHKNNKTTKDLLHSLYVAFTRPTDMLCVAIRKDVYNKFKKEIDEFNVEIINV